MGDYLEQRRENIEYCGRKYTEAGLKGFIGGVMFGALGARLASMCKYSRRSAFALKRNSLAVRPEMKRWLKTPQQLYIGLGFGLISFGMSSDRGRSLILLIFAKPRRKKNLTCAAGYDCTKTRTAAGSDKAYH